MRHGPEIRERVIEAHLVMRVRAAGGVAYKFTSPARRSVPDRIVIFPRRIVFVEVKRPGGTLTLAQAREHERLRALGCDVRMIDSRVAIDRFIAEIKS
ncbi:VRR-NUC domain protein [Caballeronia catudaia]|uniref:VRR-NUC domain protein n=1 Tax=Caballeronia catudaia TaxID=1777136 RepID=A0A158CM34_9BURK|nr:VRR-NUC domain-containing protein [Caballeronia catudaia]SAK83330.1 VRR-NUC domain protein [Caballeronia catudaia]